ncbi:MAG: lytic transglycosylase domain-containing protein [Chitinophagales bacterium]|nr:lytic transglycosylase domain-containing protein [Chitinophagales bacterium]
MKEGVLRRLRWMLLIGAAGFGILFFIQKTQSAPDPVKYSKENVLSPFDNKIYAIQIPDRMDFAGEPVPLSNTDVKQHLDRELLINAYWHSQTIYILKQYPQMISYIEPILKKNGIPHDFIYLCVAESGLQYNAMSPDGALGLWQFMKTTGQRYGLEISAEVDERLSFEKSTEAACRYLLDSKQRLGSWTLAAAAFNMGLDGLSEVIRKQKVNNYYDLYLNRETSRYIYRILALKEVMNNPSQYGFNLEVNDLYNPYKYKSVKVDTTITDLAAFAQMEKTNYKMLRVLNPWIIGYTLTNTEGKLYNIKIPIAD